MVLSSYLIRYHVQHWKYKSKACEVFIAKQGVNYLQRTPDSKFYRANMGPTWGRQDPGGPHVGPMSRAISAIVAMRGLLSERETVVPSAMISDVKRLLIPWHSQPCIWLCRIKRVSFSGKKGLILQ